MRLTSPRSEEDAARWDAFVESSPRATFFHRHGWRRTIEDATGAVPDYRAAERDGRVVGVLPMFHFASRLFGRMAVSMPFLNYGGVAGESDDVERSLADDARNRAAEAGCAYVEMRQRFASPLGLPVSDRKVTSILPLDGGADAVFARLHQNVRNKIRKAGKAGVVIVRGIENVGAFYEMYSRNLRDLGTPVIARCFFEKIAAAFPDHAMIYVARHEGRLIGAKLVFFDRDVCYFVWAAAPREELRHAPVQALNWAAIEDAVARGVKEIDFGRSTAGGTHADFKKYWGVRVEPLPWTYALIARNELPGLNPDNPKFRLAIGAWKKMPLCLTRVVGPPIARHLP